MLVDNALVERADITITKINNDRFFDITNEEFITVETIVELTKKADTFICADYECFNKNVRDKINKKINNRSD